MERQAEGVDAGGERREAPDAVRAQHVRDGIENEAIGIVAWPSAMGLRQERLNQLPLCIRQRVGIGDDTHTPYVQGSFALG